MRSNRSFRLGLQLSALLAGFVLVFIVIFLLHKSLPLISQLGIQHFFNGAGWHPQEGQFDLTPMLIGTLIVAGGAILLATPLGIIVAVFAKFYAPNILARAYLGVIELLAGIPSVVFGLWGLSVLVPWITHWLAPGTNVLAGILVLAMMILPLVVLTSHSALLKVPENYLRSAHALGISRWGMIYRIALPVAMPGILSGVILQSGRAIGETMAILMVTGNVVQVPNNLLQPVRTLTANIALEMAYAVDNHRLALFVSGLLLVSISIVLVMLGQNLTRENARQYEHA